MFALISRILNLSGRYKAVFRLHFYVHLSSPFSPKMPIFMAFIVFAGFADNTLNWKDLSVCRTWIISCCSGSDSGSLFERPSAKCRWIYDLC